MKKIYFSVLFTVMYAISFSQQENEFVEVVLTDTIKIEPDEIIFSLILQGDPDFSEEERILAGTANKNIKPKNNAGINSRFSMSIDQVNKIIAANKIDTLTTSQYNITKEEFVVSTDKRFLLRFYSSGQLDAFIKQITHLKRIFGYIVTKKSGQQAQYREALTKKILDNAYREASSIAAQSKKTIVKLEQVKEENIDATGGGWTSYPPLSALAGADYSNEIAQITLQRKLRVRYSWR